MAIQRGREAPTEAPYTGPLGATRRELAFVPAPDNAARRVEIIRGVNAATDPILARQALDGSLHRFGDLDLAVPFVYHDPAARRFALVVPAARAHEELTLRADMLARLAAETGDALPGYVREARTVLGAAGLKRYLEEPSERGRHTTPPPDPRLENLAAREERLHRRAQELNAQADEIQSRAEELDLIQNDFHVREQELESRFADLVAREEALAEEERVMRASMAALASREQVLAAREEALARREQALATDDLDASFDATFSAPPAPLDDALEGPPGDDLGAESIEPEDASALDEIDPEGDERTGQHRATALAAAAEIDPEPDAEPEELHPDDVADVSEAAEASELPAPAAPPAPEGPAAWVARGGGAYAAVIDAEVRVWLRGNAEAAHLVTAGSVAPVLQAAPDGELPLALLTLRTEGAGAPMARVVLDLTSPDDGEVLETLARDFRLRLEVVNESGRALGSYVVGAPCEVNAQRVLALLKSRAPGAPEARAAETARMRREGIATGDEGPGPALADEGALASAAGVEAALRTFEPYLAPERCQRLVVAGGAPAAQVESLGRRLVLAALRCGVTPPPSYVKHAVESGLAADEKALAARALTAYARTLEGGVEAIGRSTREASLAWGPLLAWAARVDAPVPDAARGAIASLFDPDDPASIPPPDTRPAPPPEAFKAMTDDELAGWIDHAEARLPAARELARRDAMRFAKLLGRALRLLPSRAAAELAADILKGGDAVGDVWVELLGSRRRAAAAIAAVGAGVLRLRRALNPLVQQALAKDNDDWRLFAWAAGEFGPALVRATARLDAADVDRLAWVLAHAVRAGGAREMEKARAGASTAFADAATRALNLQDEVRAYHASLRHGDGGTEVERAAHVILASATPGDGDGADGAARGA